MLLRLAGNNVPTEQDFQKVIAAAAGKKYNPDDEVTNFLIKRAVRINTLYAENGINSMLDMFSIGESKINAIAGMPQKVTGGVVAVAAGAGGAAEEKKEEKKVEVVEEEEEEEDMGFDLFG